MASDASTVLRGGQRHSKDGVPRGPRPEPYLLNVIVNSSPSS